MKTLLLLLLVALCGIAWRTPGILGALGAAPPDAPVAAPQATAPDPAHKPMSLHEYAELAKKDPEAYRKFMDSLQQPAERSEVDKLMNFFARGKYE